MSRTLRISAIVAGLALALIPAASASAHVSVSSTDAVGGSSGTLAFRVPNESDSAETTSLTVELPTDTPFRSVRAQTMPGWTIQLERTTLPEPVEVAGSTLSEAVTSVTWTADGAGVALDEYGVFVLRVGPFPEEGGTFAFPATQTYADGEVVVWGEVVEDGADEPAHPAPSLTVAAGEAGGDHGAAAGTDDSHDDSDEGGSDNTARVIGIVGVVLGAVGIGAGFLGRKSKAAA